jgi:hypothetical protein
MTVPPQIAEKNLETRWDRAIKYAQDMNQRLVDVLTEVAKEKTQYFEKIALASGGTIALVVSFVGSHAGRLQPVWLLRSALVVLVLAMIAAMYRNWKYPYYLTASYSKQHYIALRDQEKCRLDYLEAIRPNVIQEGGPIDINKTRAEFSKADKVFETKIAELEKEEKSVFNLVGWVERAALFLVVTGMGMLIALAWRNF